MDIVSVTVGMSGIAVPCYVMFNLSTAPQSPSHTNFKILKWVTVTVLRGICGMAHSAN
jgi:hypothetical protein